MSTGWSRRKLMAALAALVGASPLVGARKLISETTIEPTCERTRRWSGVDLAKAHVPSPEFMSKALEVLKNQMNKYFEDSNWCFSYAMREESSHRLREEFLEYAFHDGEEFLKIAALIAPYESPVFHDNGEISFPPRFDGEAT